MTMKVMGMGTSSPLFFLGGGIYNEKTFSLIIPLFKNQDTWQKELNSVLVSLRELRRDS
jgi:hypothetical protein